MMYIFSICTHMIYRPLYQDRIDHALEETTLLLLLWTRQVGKTTLMKYTQQKRKWETRYINLEDHFWLSFSTKKEFIVFLQWEYWVDFSNENALLLLDEVQSIKNIEVILKSLYDDEKIVCRIIATWSRFWWQSIVGSTLVWRGKQIYIYPLTFREYLLFQWKKYDNDDTIQLSWIQEELYSYLRFGWYPGLVWIQTSEQKYEYIQSIVRRIFERDIAFFLDYQEVILCKSVFDWIVMNTWNVANINNLSTELMISVHNIKKYIFLLQQSYLIQTIQPFSKETKKPKYYISDTWIYHAIAGYWEKTLHDGKVNEMVVLWQLLAYYWPHTIFYHKKKSWSEIDFLVKFYDSLACIEVKSHDSQSIPKIFYHTSLQKKQQLYKTTKQIRWWATREDITCTFVPRWDVSL